MEIDPKKQSLAIERAQEILRENEQRRAAVRLEKCFRDVVAGDVGVLENDEIVNNLAHFMYAMFEDGETKTIIAALDNLGKGTCHSKVSVRERAVMVLSIFIGLSMQNNQDYFNEIFSKILVNWLEKEEEFIAGFEIVCHQLEQQIQQLFAKRKWEEVEDLLVVIHQVQSGDLKKSNIIKSVVVRIQTQLATKDILEDLLAIYLDPYSAQKPISESLLVNLGPNSMAFLVERLTVEESRDNRFRLLELIPNNDQVYSILEKTLQNDPPWYVVRNAILIFSRENSDRCYDVVQSYADHTDMRVQQQVINGVWKMGGDELDERLLTTLLRINDELKINLVNQLGQLEGNSKIGSGLIGLLESREYFQSLAKDELTLVLCQTLVNFPSKEVAVSLEGVIAEREEKFGGDDRILLAARKNHEKVTLDSGSQAKSEKNAAPSAFDDDLLTLDFAESLGSEEEIAVAPKDEMVPVEPEVEEEEDDAFLAIMAETQKGAAGLTTLDDIELEEAEDHLTVWSDFYDSLDSDEFTTFYALLEKKGYLPADVIMERGAADKKLFFIDAGDVDLLATDDSAKMRLKNLRGGNLVGSGVFFGSSPWPFFLIAQDKVSCHVLDCARCQGFLDRFPQVMEKLKNYCKSQDVISWLLKMLDEEEAVSSDVKIINMNKKLKSVADSEGDAKLGSCYGVIKGGMCIEVETTDSTQNRELTGLLIEALLCDKDEKCEKSYGVIIGWQVSDTDVNRVRLLVNFYHPYRTEQYRCSSLTLL